MAATAAARASAATEDGNQDGSSSRAAGGGGGGVPGGGPTGTSARTPTTRYSLANGCYALRSVARDRFTLKRDGGYHASAATVGGAERFDLKPTRLGSYLLYDRNRRLLAIDVLGRVAPAPKASKAADWNVTGRRSTGFGLRNRREGESLALARGGSRAAGSSCSRARVPCSRSLPPRAAASTRRSR
ncbi:MAG TPA: hypothetical protein VK387_07985 [Thermoleophilaceae bacterium]|nr:hypothetical protein [Thermoleophilaceae bacterium]